MKQALLLTALVIGLYSCKDSTKATTTETTKTEAATPVKEVSIVGKWHAVDMDMEMEPGEKKPSKEEIKAHMAKQDMTYEFTADGKMKITGAGPSAEGTYTRDGNTLKTTTPGKEGTDDFEIATLNDKEMQLKMAKEKMSMTFQRL